MLLADFPLISTWPLEEHPQQGGTISEIRGFVFKAVLFHERTDLPIRLYDTAHQRSMHNKMANG